LVEIGNDRTRASRAEEQEEERESTHGICRLVLFLRTDARDSDQENLGGDQVQLFLISYHTKSGSVRSAIALTVFSANPHDSHSEGDANDRLSAHRQPLLCNPDLGSVPTGLTYFNQKFFDIAFME
jgi:hypothetical protein